MSRIDVIVPCYNYGRFLRECVGSILSQPVDVRVLIIDDASTDNTEKIAKELVAQDCRVEYRRHPANEGHIATYNEGLEWVTGEYNLVLSADDALVPGVSARATHLLDAEPGVGLVFGKDLVLRSSDSKPTPRTTLEHCSRKIIKGTELIDECCAQGNNIVPTPTAIIRTALLRQVGYYRPDLPHTADMAMWLKYAAYADVGVLDADQAYYRIHDESMHLRLFGRLSRVRQVKAAFEALFAEAGHRLPDRETLRNKAMKAIAIQALSGAYVTFDEQDLDGCRELLQLAVACCPDVVREKLWRFKVKLWVGPRTWKLLRRLAYRYHASL